MDVNNYDSNNFDEQIEQLKKGIVYSHEEINEIIDEIHDKYKNTSIMRVCAYGRVSTKRDEQESSLLTQHTIFSTYCESHRNKGYVLVEEIYEQKTGTLRSKREKFQQMIEDAKNGLYDILLFKDSKRFSRNTEDFLGLVEELKRLHIYVVFIAEGCNSKEEKDRTMFTLLGMMSENYSNALHISTSAAIRVRQESELGRVPGNIFGYKRVKGNSSKSVIVEWQAELLRELFNRYAEGEGISSICKDWQERGIKTYGGGNIAPFCLRRFIRNPLYKGVLIMGKFTKPDVRAKRVRNADEDLIVRQRDDLIIIEPELWDKCNAIMDANKKKQDNYGCFAVKTDTLKEKLFCKKIICGECGRNYNRKDGKRQKNGTRYIYLMCGYKKYSKAGQVNREPCHNEKVIRLDSLTEIISVFLRGLIESQDELKTLVRTKIVSYINEMNVKNIDKKTKEELTIAQERFKRIIVLYKDGAIPEAEYREAKAEVKRLENEIRINKLLNISEEEINNLADKFINNLTEIMKSEISDESNLDIKAFNSLFRNIVIYNDHIDIIFNMFGNRHLERLGNIDIKQCLADGYKELRFVAPCIDLETLSCPKGADYVSECAFRFYSEGRTDHNHRRFGRAADSRRQQPGAAGDTKCKCGGCL